MIKKLKKFFNFMTSRLFLVALMLFLQVSLIVGALYYFGQSVFYVYIALNALSFLAVVAVVNIDENPSYKLTWTIAILLLPLTGGAFYLMFGNKRMSKKLKRRIDGTLDHTTRHTESNRLCEERLLPEYPHLALQSRYIYNMTGYPVQEGTSARYFPLGEDMFESMLKELKKAKRYIFLEYFIIRPGIMWDSIFEVLRLKVRQGVEVRLMYDDLGCISSLPKGYDRIIRSAGIKLCIFNPFRPRVNVLMNSRDHRKILVIDGKTGFCGGINLADEYINARERFGHWKDTGVMLKGEAVWSFSLMYLQLWHFSTDEVIDYDFYRPENPARPGDGLVQVFSDSPLDKYNVTETAYLNIIGRATRYVYITTPYLVIDYEMEQALCNAASAGIDVRIITPYHYDKWYVHKLTRSHYDKLIRAGVKIYEYTPGFMHGKMFVSDDQVGMVGTCNMDFRSFYLHFECSVTFYHSSVIRKVKEDILACQKLSHRVTLEDGKNVSPWSRAVRAFLKIFAPLM